MSLTRRHDRICNYIGNQAMVEKTLQWSGKEGFSAESLRTWTVDGHKAGIMKSHGPLTFATVYGAG